MVSVTPCGEQQLKFRLSYFAFQLMFPVKLLGVSAPQMYSGLTKDLEVTDIYANLRAPRRPPSSQ